MRGSLGSSSIIWDWHYTNLTFYNSVAKGLKLKVRKFFGANSYVCKSYRGKTGPFCTPTPLRHSILNIVKSLKAVMEFFPSFKSFKSRKKVTESFFSGHASLSFQMMHKFPEAMFSLSVPTEFL